ncbi:MAG: glycosyltransferase family 2 protein [Nitrospiraceae bacterium]|nr:glycosyltransferase family 2 protein [Nitrospiraceae bacterium]
MALTIISIVTPSFNQGRFIEETIRSILAQEGDFFIDYIVVDGGSTDQSVDIIRKYDILLREGTLDTACRGITYRWVSEKDRGQVDALKKGFRMAKGDIFCWLNSDDVYLERDVLQRVSSYFSADKDLELLTADGFFINENGQTSGLHHVDRIVFKELLYLDYHILQPSTFFRRKIYAEDSLREKYVCALDADFFIRLIWEGVKYKKTDDIMSGFRIYPEIKTVALAGTRYREQLAIAQLYSNNILLLAVSAVYRYFEIILRQKLPPRLFQAFFPTLKSLSYWIITGKRGR